ncbi:COR domain-containing protein [Vibrio diabolicus]|uniref:COR domain-containing protein n=1 Tax=Vibrio diabolicus TaxID=50719 RepID=UPI003D7DC684
MKEIDIKLLHEFRDWLDLQIENKVIIGHDEDRQLDNFSLIIKENTISIYLGHDRHVEYNKTLFRKIYEKLDELGLLPSVKSCEIPIQRNSLEYLEKMSSIKEVHLGTELSDVDISKYTSIETVTFTIGEDTSITFPKSIKNSRINIDDSHFNESCLQSLIEDTNLINLTIILFNKYVELDIEGYKLEKIRSLTVATTSESSINIGSNLPSLKSLIIHGGFGSTKNIHTKITLPDNLTRLTLIDCEINTKDFHKNCTKLKNITILNNSIDLGIINDILKNNTATNIVINLNRASIPAKEVMDWKLSKTKVLNLQGFNFENLDFINNAKNLKDLSLNDCNLNEFPQNLPKQLRKISLRYNKEINELPTNISENIININVENCNIVNIPKYYLLNFLISTSRNSSFDEESDPNTLQIYNNPIENPPLEILKGPTEGIRTYVNSMIGTSTVLNEAKIIFVGDGSVGKTSLMKRLVYDKFDAAESQTDGIEIEPFTVDLGAEGTVNATIWDFGGQQILQATHQLFLSKRSIYVLVVEDRKNDKHKDQDIEQWLTQVNSLGGRPPILVVKNKIDENPHSDIQTQKLKSKFPNIVGFFEISCQQRKGLEKLHTALSDCIRTLPMRKIALPKNWLDVKLQLKEQASSFDLLYLNTYEDICTQNGISAKFARDTLLRLLHDLGAVIAFEELKSHNTAILNPHWITEGIYAIIRSEVLAENNGVITLEGAQTALDNYSEHNRFDDKASYILDAMRNFELCHATEETNTYLIPALLPPQINLSQSWGNEYEDHKERIVFLFRFEHLLPPPLLPMFLVKMHNYIVGEQRWRSGAIISPTHLDAKALVDADNVTREIRLTIIGSERRDLLVLLRAEINNIAQRLADINEIGLQEHVVLGASNETIGYADLIGLKQMGVSEFPVGRLGKTFPVSSLLGEIEAPADTEKALKVLMKSSRNGLINLNMIQRNENNATGGNANNSVTANTSNVNTNQNTATSTAEIKQELRSLKGQAEFVLEDIRDEINDLTSSDRQLKDYASKECEKVEKAINELTNNVDSQETADENLRHFSRIQNFLDGALKKTNSVGKVIDKAGNVYSEVEKLAVKFNEIAGKFAMPTVALLGLGG